MTAQPQHMVALAGANTANQTYAAIGREVQALGRHDGPAKVAEMLVDYNETDPIAGMKVQRLLMAIRGFGEYQTTYLLALAGVRIGGKQVRELTDRQRRLIADELQGLS